MAVLVEEPAAELSPRSDRRPHLPGEAGLWVFVIGDMVMFGAFFAVIAVLRVQQPATFLAGQQELHVGLGVSNTVLLLTGSWLVARAVRAVHRYGSTSPSLFIAALACALGFAVTKVLEYVALVDAGHTPQSDDYFMYYFVFTGIHLAHLVIGVIVLICLAAVTRRPSLTQGQVMFVEGGGVYWHLVDMLWLVLFPLLYLVR